MSRKSSAFVPGLPPLKDFRKGFELRPGQLGLYRKLQESDLDSLNLHWPGGYGKSVGIALSFRTMIEKGIANRLLVVVANTTQLDQILNDFRSDCRDVGVCLKSKPWKVTREPSTIKASLTGKYCVFVTTIQAVSATNRNGVDTLLALLRSGGSWMLAADEYQHYAAERDWGISLSRAVDESVFSLATSATPYRDVVPTIFGEPDPDMKVLYKDAAAAGHVKKAYIASYDYAVDAMDVSGDPLQYTTEELRELIGGAKSVDQWEHKYQLRYLTKYIHPLLHRPIGRLIGRRLHTGKRLQMLVRGIGCRHAQALCKQIQSLTDLSVDWVGTGPNGRTEDENQKIKRQFCPPKDDRTGLRPEPDLDILVQVGLAGEGFDCINVVEIIDFGIVLMTGTANDTRQFMYRGSRAVGDEALRVNVPTDHPLARIKNLMAWFDGYPSINEDPESADGNDDREDNDWEPPDLPKELRRPKVIDANLLNVTMESPEVIAVVEVIKKDRKYQDVVFTQADYLDLARKALSASALEQQEELTLSAMRSQLDKEIGALAYKLVKSRDVFEKSLIADYKKRLNGRIKREFGDRSQLLPDSLDRIHVWLKELEVNIKEGDIPRWLR